MALPENVGKGTITGTILDEDGDPASGSVTFDPAPDNLRNASADRVIVLGSTTVDLVAGAFSVDLVATDDEDMTPVDWTYSVSFKLASGRIDTFSTSVPEGSTQDLADIVPVARSGGVGVIRGPGVPPGGTTGQVLAKKSAVDDDTEWVDVEGITAPALTDLTDTNLGSIADGQGIRYDADSQTFVPADFDAVESVNGLTGAVSLGAADVGARADDWVPSTSDVTGLQSALDDLQDQITALTAALDSKLDKKPGVTMRAAGYGPSLPTTDNQDGDVFYVPEVD